MTESEVARLAETIKTGGALSCLKELECEINCAHIIIGALVGKAPCVCTLETLRIEEKSNLAMRMQVSAMLSAWGDGACFPRLTELTLKGYHFSTYEDQKLAEALVKLITNSAPSRLETLEVHGLENCLDFLNELIPAFRAGALPRLVKLTLENREELTATDVLVPEWW